MPSPDDLLFLGYELLSALLPFLLSCCLFARLTRPLPAHTWALVLVFALYITGVYHFTGAGTLYEGLRYRLPLREQWNLIPFSHTIDPTGYFLNILLFLPLGLLVPLIWSRLGRFWQVLCLGAGFSLFVELTQLLNIRASDVDDLILNTAGTALGFAAFKVFDRISGSGCRQRAPVSLLPLCLLTPYLSRFFLYDDMGLARLLYGF